MLGVCMNEYGVGATHIAAAPYERRRCRGSQHFRLAWQKPQPGAQTHGKPGPTALDALRGPRGNRTPRFMAIRVLLM
jgi:hypothetical protein